MPFKTWFDAKGDQRTRGNAQRMSPWYLGALNKKVSIQILVTIEENRYSFLGG